MHQYERAIRDALPRREAERKIEQIKRQQWFVKNKTEPVTGFRLKAIEAAQERRNEEIAREADKLK